MGKNYYNGYRPLEMMLQTDVFFNFIEAYYELGRTFWHAGEKTEAENVWKAGNSANRFSDWGKRCAEAVRLVKAGKEPPSFS